MSRYIEMDRRRKRARSLYLELRALGLEICVEGDGDCPTGYRIVVGGFKSLSPVHADAIKHRVMENEAGLAKILLSRYDPDLHAVRREGSCR